MRDRAEMRFATAFNRFFAAVTAGAALSSMLIYLVMAIVLFVRPEGLLPSKGRT